MDRKLVNYLPPAVRSMRELRTISDSEQTEISTLWDAVDSVFDDQFIESSTEYGVSRWESILSVTPKGTEALDARRLRIKSRLNEQLPFTMPALRRMLDVLCGEDGYSLGMARGSYTLSVELDHADNMYSLYAEVLSMLHRVVPAHLVFGVKTICELPAATVISRAAVGGPVYYRRLDYDTYYSAAAAAAVTARTAASTYRRTVIGGE